MPQKTLPPGAITALASATGLDRTVLSKAYHRHRTLTADHVNQILRSFQFLEVETIARLNEPQLITYLCSIIDHCHYMQQIMQCQLTQQEAYHE